MEDRNLESWDQFKAVIDELRGKYGYHESSTDKGQTFTERNIVLFRGQPDLPIKTTLERKSSEEFTLTRYL
jgi:hypothetical protein